MFRLTRPRSLVLLSVLLGSAAVAATTSALLMQPERIDTSRLRQTFAEEFDKELLASKRWTQGSAADRLDERTIVWNAERQVYFSPDWLGLGIQPVSIANGLLTITARPLSPQEKAVVRSNIAGVPEWARKPALERLDYASGRITTRDRFAQRYGYFEARVRYSPGRGLWPAVWLLPADRSWPPEIDIMEALGHEPAVAYQTIHSAAQERQGIKVDLNASDSGYHLYGVMWGAKTIDTYVDGVKTGSFKTPSDAHKPMYLIVNLAVGGHWPGYPDASTKFPATMEVDYVRAWRHPGT